MRWLNPFQFLTILSVTLFLELVPLPRFMGVTQAQIRFNSQSNFQLPDPGNSLQQSLAAGTSIMDFQPPESNLEPAEGNGDPGTSVGGATRGDECQPNGDEVDNAEITETEVQETVTVLMPACHLGLTFSERPTFFLYFPQSPDQPIFFTLEDESGNTYYEGELSVLTDSSGLSRVSLPESAPSLELDQTYVWSLITLYQGELLMLEGGEIKRVQETATIAGYSDQNPSLELAAEYASQGIWFDLVKVLAELRSTEPDNPEVLQAWDNLLKDKDVALDALANQLLP